MIDTIIDKSTVRLIAFIVLLVHGIGHLQGVITGFGARLRPGCTSRSWLLGFLGAGINKFLCVLLYLAAAVCGIIAALCFNEMLLAEELWLTFATWSAYSSLLALVLFPKALVMFFNKAGALAVDLIIVYSIILEHEWPEILFD